MKVSGGFIERQRGQRNTLVPSTCLSFYYSANVQDDSKIVRVTWVGRSLYQGKFGKFVSNKWNIFFPPNLTSALIQSRLNPPWANQQTLSLIRRSFFFAERKPIKCSRSLDVIGQTLSHSSQLIRSVTARSKSCTVVVNRTCQIMCDILVPNETWFHVKLPPGSANCAANPGHRWQLVLVFICGFYREASTNHWFYFLTCTCLRGGVGL